jgi:hypothetical protein
MHVSVLMCVCVYVSVCVLVYVCIYARVCVCARGLVYRTTLSVLRLYRVGGAATKYEYVALVWTY